MNKSKIESTVTISARIIRADGTIEDKGVICTTAKQKKRKAAKQWQTRHM